MCLILLVVMNEAMKDSQPNFLHVPYSNPNQKNIKTPCILFKERGEKRWKGLGNIKKAEKRLHYKTTRFCFHSFAKLA